MRSSKRRRWVVAFMLMLAPLRVWADSQPTIDVEGAVALALKNNLGIKTEQLKLEDKALVRDTAWNLFIPSVTASASMSRLNAASQIGAGLIPNLTDPIGPNVYGSVIATPPFDLPQWGVGVRLSAQLTVSPQMLYGIRQTVLDYEAGVTSLEMARESIERSVRQGFYNLLLLQRSIALQKNAIATAAERLAQTKQNYQNGLVDEYTYLSAQVALANQKPVLDELQSGYDTAIMAFDQSIGLDVTVTPALSGTIQAEPISVAAKDADRLIAVYLDGRYDLRSLHQSIGQLENLIKVSESSFYPTLTFGYSADPTFLGDPLKDAWFADIKNDWKQMSGMFFVTFGLRIDPLLPASQTRVQIAKYRSQLQQTQNALAQAREGAMIEVRKNVATIERTKNTLEVKKMNVELAQRALGLAETGYRAGTRDLLDVRSAEQDLQRAQVDELSDEYTYTVGLLDLEAALNTSIERIKETINGN